MNDDNDVLEETDRLTSSSLEEAAVKYLSVGSTSVNPNSENNNEEYGGSQEVTDPDSGSGDIESLRYYGKLKDYAMGSVWFASAFNVFLAGGLITIWLIKTAFIASEIPLDFPMELVGIAWFLGVSCFAVISICCSIYAYFNPLPEERHTPFYRNHATLGVGLTVFGVAVGVFLILALR